MSTSEQEPTTPRSLTRQELTPHERTVLDGEGTRTDRAVSWVGWHIGELFAVGLPLVLAATVSVWCALISVLAGTAWAVHEARHAREQRSVGAEAERRQLAARSAETDASAVEADGERGSAEGRTGANA